LQIGYCPKETIATAVRLTKQLSGRVAVQQGLEGFELERFQLGGVPPLPVIQEPSEPLLSVVSTPFKETGPTTTADALDLFDLIPLPVEPYRLKADAG
jgi:hypothetical protein